MVLYCESVSKKAPRHEPAGPLENLFVLLALLVHKSNFFIGMVWLGNEPIPGPSLSI